MPNIWNCEHPLHDPHDKQGKYIGRSGVHPHDRFVRRTTFVRSDGRERLYERSHERICRVCIERDEKQRRDSTGQGVLT
jgi:hypothetical protein